jgi:hypothetical protein
MGAQRPSTFQFLDEQKLLGGLWPGLERYVNSARPAQAVDPNEGGVDATVGRLATDTEEIGPTEWHDLRRLLAALVRGGTLPPELASMAPSAPLALGRDGWILVEPRAGKDRLDRFYFTVALLRLPALRPLLRLCDRCARFFLGSRVHRRPHTFCSPKCRYAFHREQRGSSAHADYMRGYRHLKAKRRERRRQLAKRGR